MLRDFISGFFWRQFGKPSGLFGRFIGNKMAQGNAYDASWTISLLDIQPESRVLEIGFGPGVSTQFASEKAPKGFVAGIDHSRTMVQAARKRNATAIRAGQMDLKQGDVASIPYPDESFDRAFSLHSIYFWARPVDCLKELRRVLKPGGLLAITNEIRTVSRPNAIFSSKFLSVVPPPEISTAMRSGEVGMIVVPRFHFG